MAKSRKTFEVASILEDANFFLKESGNGLSGSPERRQGHIDVMAHILFSACCYGGFEYLTQDEVPVGELPGIRFSGDTSGIPKKELFKDTDSTRVRYLITKVKDEPYRTKIRKTFEVASMLESANFFLKESGNGLSGSPERRQGHIDLVSLILTSACCYGGFEYLTQDEVPAGEPPGIRFSGDTSGTPKEELFKDTDSTRVRYLIKTTNY